MDPLGTPFVPGAVSGTVSGAAPGVGSGLAFGELGTLGLGALLTLVVAALLIGFSKTAIGGVALISVAVFAAVLPSRLSTGVVLPLLIVGDVVAVRSYHAHADWRTLIRLIPAVLVGMAAGWAFIAQVDDTVMRRAIGAILLALVALQLLTRWRQRTATSAPSGSRPESSTTPPTTPPTAPPTSPPTPPTSPRTSGQRLAAWGYGSLAGFTTAVANTGGPAMSLYLLAARYTVLAFMGTMSWFFFMINVVKVPMGAALQIITPSTLLLDLVLVIPVLVGTWIGRWTLPRVSQQLFERLVLITTVLAAANLIR